MRLNSTELSMIKAAAKASLASGSRVLLFGSRTDDNLRGGDIDLLVELQGAFKASDVVAQRAAFAAKLYRSMGERRIDIVITPAGQPDPRPIATAARRDGIELVRT
jgi:uncharacterized protein